MLCCISWIRLLVHIQGESGLKGVLKNAQNKLLSRTMAEVDLKIGGIPNPNPSFVHHYKKTNTMFTRNINIGFRLVSPETALEQPLRCPVAMGEKTKKHMSSCMFFFVEFKGEPSPTKSWNKRASLANSPSEAQPSLLGIGKSRPHPSEVLATQVN